MATTARARRFHPRLTTAAQRSSLPHTHMHHQTPSFNVDGPLEPGELEISHILRSMSLRGEAGSPNVYGVILILMRLRCVCFAVYLFMDVMSLLLVICATSG